MTTCNTQIMTNVYEGSVKTVFTDNNNKMINYFAFSDYYSVFDWGRMPDQITSKGKALSLFGGFIFNRLAQPQSWQDLLEDPILCKKFSKAFVDRLFSSDTYARLCKNALKHHFIEWVDETGQTVSWESMLVSPPLSAPLMKVRAVSVKRPSCFTIEQSTLYDYDRFCTLKDPKLIPLEVVFRFGMPAGNSLQKRLDKNPLYYTELGLNEQPQTDRFFERPVLEFFTKLEPTDRFLSLQEAFLISGLTQDEFKELYDTTLLLSLWLYSDFAKKNIELWDGKFEFAWTSEGLMLVDSIGPDELRLKYDGVQLSKEVVRQYYKDSSWKKAVDSAKTIAASKPGLNWKTICIEQLEESPQPLSLREKNLVNNLYGALVNHYLEKPLIETFMSLEEVVSELKEKQFEAGL